MLNQSQLEECTKQECCYNCKFFFYESEILSDKTIGFKTRICRRNPPKPDTNGYGRFPSVGITEWCGSYQKKAGA